MYSTTHPPCRPVFKKHFDHLYQQVGIMMSDHSVPCTDLWAVKKEREKKENILFTAGQLLPQLTV